MGPRRLGRERSRAILDGQRPKRRAIRVGEEFPVRTPGGVLRLCVQAGHLHGQVVTAFGRDIPTAIHRLKRINLGVKGIRERDAPTIG